MISRLYATLAPGILAVMLLAGCSPEEAATRNADTQSARPTYTYTCSESLRFTARFENEAAVLTLPDRELRLPQVVSGSGARYSDGKITFWIKGDAASLEIDGKTYPDCQGLPEQAP